MGRAGPLVSEARVQLAAVDAADARGAPRAARAQPSTRGDAPVVQPPVGQQPQRELRATAPKCSYCVLPKTRCEET